MSPRRKSYSASRSRRTSRQMDRSTVGTHVARPATYRSARAPHRDSRYAAAISRRARLRRIAVAVIAIAIVAAVALGAGFLAFRGTVGGQLALDNSDARDALTSARSGEPSFTLISVELGSVAAPLDNEGPDTIMLARLDADNQTLALIAFPPNLQITSDNRSESLSARARQGDAALISSVSSFAKVDISHFVKLADGDVAGMVDALGGIEIDVDQVIDDPHAGTAYIEPGTHLLDGAQAATYLRADNLEYGAEDQIAHQARFAAALIAKLFSNEGALANRVELVAPFIQTDCSLADIEQVNSWLAGTAPADITCAVVPGYFTVVTNVTADSGKRYIGSATDLATLLTDLDEGRAPSVGSLEDSDPVSPGSFVVDVQNGTTIEGAAAAASSLLKSNGFIVGDVGNAEQPVFEETLVVYKDGDAGLAQAKTVIEAMGFGRPVESSSYYTFEHDVLLILGADSKPVS